MRRAGVGGRASLVRLRDSTSRMESLLVSFIRRGGGSRVWKRGEMPPLEPLECCWAEQGSFAFLDNELISHPGPLKQQKYMLMLLWRIQRSDQASQCGPGYSFYSLPIGGKQGSDPDGVDPSSSKLMGWLPFSLSERLTRLSSP